MIKFNKNMTSLPQKFKHPYTPAAAFQKSVAYFSMEFAIDQSLKTYSGGLGFLAGSHIRSAYELKQNVIGIGMLWKHGYYDQTRATKNEMDVLFREQFYGFIEDTGVTFQIDIQGSPVWVRAFYLDPKHFNTVPMFFLTTDTNGNDLETRKLSYHLYDNDVATKVKQCMILGIGGAKFLDVINYEPDVYHLNEAHAVSAVFHLYKKHGSLAEVKKRLVFTTHTPEEAGNEKHDIHLLESLGFFANVPLAEVRTITGLTDHVFNHSLVALRMSRKANGVSKLHGEVSRKMWGGYKDICEITHVTNAQNKNYWADADLEKLRQKADTEGIAKRKLAMKNPLFSVVADQCGKLFDPKVLTIVWARRFAAYKRPDLLPNFRQQFDDLMRNTKYPIQFVWAGKPYPKDTGAINTFNNLVYLSHLYPNMAVVTGHELGLSRVLKHGADLWLNTPIVPREASGTSGMTAAMNASINVSTDDGWICEFAKHGQNAFVVQPAAPANANDFERDYYDAMNLFKILNEEILPMYYDRKADWNKLVLESMNNVGEFFESGRMATEYYEKVY